MEMEKKALVNMLNSRFCKNLMKENIMRISKNDAMSEMIRRDGNMIFVSSGHDAESHEQIWKLYSISIAAAENNSEALALAHGNRSALMLHLGKFDGSIKDIDQAIQTTKNTVFKIKMLCRKAKCLHALENNEKTNVLKEAELLLEEVTNKDNKEMLKELIHKTKISLEKPVKLKSLPKDKTPQMLKNLYEKHAVNDFSGIEIKYNEKYGRHLVANKDFKSGEVIYIEKPYTKFLNLTKLHAYCSHCFTVTWANVPCEKCSWTMFCSEECRKEAWEQYHDLECSTYGWSRKDNNDTYKQLAVRTLILAIKEAGSIENLKAELEAFDENTDIFKGFLKDGKIETTGYKTIYTLAKDVVLDCLQIHTVNTAMVLRALSRTTPFFGEDFDYKNNRNFKRNETAMFLGALILRLSKIAQLNCHQMWNGNYVCDNDFDRLKCWDNECCSKGVYIAPITSLLNHDCDPNARRCYSNDHNVILYAIKPIKKGSQIFDCYQQEYYELDTIPRRKLLDACYNFNCDCVACEKKWPHLINIFQKNRLAGSAKMHPIEVQLQLEYKDLIPSTLNKKARYNENTIVHLGKGIEKGLKKLTQPAFVTVNLLICLNTIFERLYGIKLTIPDECLNI